MRFPTENRKRSTARGAKARRKFLQTAAIAAGAAAATLAMPNVSRAQTVSFKFQSSWTPEDIFHEFANDYVTKVNEMTGTGFRLELLPAGAIAAPLQMQDAIIAGALDGGHGVTAYWYGKSKAYALFGTPPAFGWRANQLLAWIRYGGGQELYDELVQKILGLNLVGFLSGPMPTQPLGWFKKPIKSPDDFKNLKYRTSGLSADLNVEMGASVTIMAGSDLVSAIDRGLLDGAEFNNPSSDRALGLPSVSKSYMLQSYHQSCECFEIIFNKTRYDGLPAEVQAILRYAAEAASSDMSWKAWDRYSKDLEAMRNEQGVKTYKTPDSVLKAQLGAWDKVVERLSADPFFKKVVDSQKDWARRVVGFQLEYEVPQELAYSHFFGA
jgi:TRAP-type mannitol/chloroaromatic compound transport system substrate-binding protein